LLTSDVCQITDALVSGGTLFTSLMNFLESDRPLNSLQASFYGKLVALLISRRGELVWHCYTQARQRHSEARETFSPGRIWGSDWGVG